MVLFNYSTKEITAKIVYYGPGLCGKTTNLQFIYESLPQTINKGKMLSLATKTDRTLFFDFLPIELGTIRGMRTRLQLYTVPGQVFYNTTRKLVLKGADGVVFVADSQRRMLDANIESFKNLEENLAEHDMKLGSIPLVIQFNKRDLTDVAGIEELNHAINKHNAPIYEAVATTGIGVHETLHAVTRLVLNSLKERYAIKSEAKEEVSLRTAALAAASTGPTPAAEPRFPPPASAAAPVELPMDLGHEPERLDLEEPQVEDEPIEIPLMTEEPDLSALGDLDIASEETTDEQFLELAIDSGENPAALGEEWLELAEEIPPLDLEPVEEPAEHPTSVLDMTEQLFRIDLPEPAGPETSPGVGPNRLWVPEEETEAEPLEDLPLSSVEPLPVAQETPYDAGPSRWTPPIENDVVAASEVPNVIEVAAVTAGVHEIMLPITLTIGDKSVDFQLRISLDLTRPLPGQESKERAGQGTR